MSGRKVEINKMEPLPLTSNENLPQSNSEGKKPNIVKKAYSRLVNNIKNLATKKQNNNEEPKAENVEISSSQEQPIESEPKTCKDKVANAIITKVEVEKNRTVFFTLLAIGCFLLCINIMMIPLIITSPGKFSMTLAFGSLFILISFLFYYGTKNYILKLFNSKRFILTILFLCSIILAFIFKIIDNYFLSLISSLIQLLCFILFGLSFIPGGQKGISYIKKKVSSPFVKIFMNLAKREISSNN